MLGLGESDEEIERALNDIRAANVDVVTMGQYMRPTKNHLPAALRDARRVSEVPRVRPACKPSRPWPAPSCTPATAPNACWRATTGLDAVNPRCWRHTRLGRRVAALLGANPGCRGVAWVSRAASPASSSAASCSAASPGVRPACCAGADRPPASVLKISSTWP